MSSERSSNITSSVTCIPAGFRVVVLHTIVMYCVYLTTKKVFASRRVIIAGLKGTFACN